jgi:secreted PhoX family phosphatase
VERRDFLRTGLLTAGALSFGRGFWTAAYAAPARPGAGPYGPLLAPDANGVMLPEGFTSRVVATSGQLVPGTTYTWHAAPDGAAVFATADGGWIHAVNSETPGTGGVGAIRYGRDGSIVDAYRILSGTSQNCAGGATPWGTWLSCEEYDFSDAAGPAGQVWECDPTDAGQGVVRPALGAFSHEAVAVDAVGQRLYLTEDQPDGRLYRFTPDAYPSLDTGLLEVAIVSEDGATTWAEVPDPSARSGPTRRQVPASRAFDGGEGIWEDEGYVYFTTKGTNRVWVHDIAGELTTVLYDATDHAEPPLTGVDNVVVASSGDLIVAEDGGNLELVLIAADTRQVAPIMRLVGDEHAASEITGPVFSPDGSRLYFSSQRGGTGTGITYEIHGPFRTQRVGIAAETAPERDVPAPVEDPSPRPDGDEQPPAPDAVTPDQGHLPSTGGGRGPAALGLTAVAAAAAARWATRPSTGERG